MSEAHTTPGSAPGDTTEPRTTESAAPSTRSRWWPHQLTPLPSSSPALEPPVDALREAFEAVVRAALAHHESLASDSGRAPNLDHAMAASRTATLPIGEAPHPGGLDDLVRRFVDGANQALPTTGAGYLAYVPGGGLPAAVLADVLAGTFNRHTGTGPASPVFARWEQDALDALARAFGYDARARGLFTSGGSLANLAGIVTAREALLGDDVDLRLATAYTSSQVHHSVAKAIAVAGIPRANLREVAVDAELRLDVTALREAITKDRSEGRRPFLVIAAAGTTNTGAIDPLPALADLCQAEGLWLHVDGAYGGAFVLCPTGRRLLTGIERADSITFDPHKGLFLPYGTGCVLVRDGLALRHAHRGAGAYLRDLAIDPDELPNPSLHGPELSRSYRGYRVWLAMQLHGLAAFRDALEEKLALARWLHTSLQAAIDRGAPLELAVAPQCSVVAFRVRRTTHEPIEHWNKRTAALLDAIHARGRVVLSSTLLPVSGEATSSALTLRACILSFRSHGAIVEAALEDILLATEELASRG